MNFYIPVLFLLTLNFQVSGQFLIDHDTVISRTIHVNGSFELPFETWPSPGLSWYLPGGYDSTALLIETTKQELMEGQKPDGGKWIWTYRFTALKKGNYELIYYYGRIWIQERKKKVTVHIQTT